MKCSHGFCLTAFALGSTEGNCPAHLRQFWCGDNPGPGRPENKWPQSLADDHIESFKANDGSTDNPPLLYGLVTVLWLRTAKKGENWYRGVVDAAGHFMANWHRGEGDKSWPIHVTSETHNSKQAKRKGGGWGVAHRYRCGRTLQRNGTWCGKVPVRLICRAFSSTA